VSEHGFGPGTDDAQAGSPGTPTQPTTPMPPAGGTTPAQPYYGGHAPWTQPQVQTPPSPPYYPGYGGHPFPAPEPVPAAQPSRRTGRLRIGVAGLVAGALIGGGAGAGVAGLLDHPSSSASPSASAQSVTIKNPETATTATAAAAKAAPSVVTLYVSSGSNSGSGSGVVLTDDGYILTNNHVVTLEGSGTGTVQVRTADGTLYDAKVVGTDPSSDLAVVKIDASGLTAATFANSDKVQVGDVAVAIGAPLGLSNTVTDGIVSATGRAVETGSSQDDSTVLDAIQTDAAINPGNSGGALVNGAGEVIGINSAIATVASGGPGSQSQSGNIGVGFAIPANTAQRIAKELIAHGKATRAFLGVSSRTAADDQNSGVGDGAEIVSVQAGSAAADAGLKTGDVVTAVGNRPVTTSTELTAAVRSKAPGSKVTLTVKRGNNTTTVDVTLGSAS
jgi:putative serine protease PepD